jgi:NADP-dependent 3-hydroxy acid dehydrogenase YdfG
LKIVITGASSGIGLATAQLLAAQKFDLVLIARRLDRLTQIRKDLLLLYNIEIEIFQIDVCDYEAVNLHLKDLENVDVLINNAGLALGLSHVTDGVIDEWNRMIDTNIKGVLNLTKVIGAKMKTAKLGHIINIGSTAAKDVYPNGGVYCATKQSVDAISKALRIELLPYCVKVTVVHPGMVETEFSEVRFDGDKVRAKKAYDGIEPLTPADVAEVILFAIKRPKNVNINEIIMTCTAQANSNFVHRIHD